MREGTFATTPKWAAPLPLALSVAAVALVALGHALFAGALHPLDDCTYAAAARNAWEHGAWLPLRYDGHAFYQHGPLVPWSMAALFGAFGVHEAWARLPSVLAGLGTVALTFAAAKYQLRRSIDAPDSRTPDMLMGVHRAQLTRELITKQPDEPRRDDGERPWLAGLLAVLVLLTTESFLRFSGRARLDAPLCFATLLAAFGVMRAAERPLRGYVIAGLGAGLAVCAKGAAGVVVLPAVLVAIVLSRQGRDLATRAPYIGLAVALALPAPWLAYLLAQDAQAYTQGYIIGFVGEALTEGRGMAPRGSAYYLRLLLESYWPWLIVVVLAFLREARGAFARRPVSPFAAVALVFGLALAVPRTKYPHYAMPLYPLFAVLCGVTLARWLTPVRVRRAVVVGWYGLCAAAIVALLLFPKAMHRSVLGEAFRALAPTLQARTPPSARVAFVDGLDRWEVVAGLEFYARRLTAASSVSLDEAAAVLARGGGPIVAPASVATTPRFAPFSAPPCGPRGPLALLCARTPGR